MAKITTGQMFEQWELMNQKLEALDQKMNGIIDGSTPANTQLTGSNVEKVAVFNALAIADTNEHLERIDIKKYKRIYLLATNNLNVAVTLTIRLDSTSTSRLWNGEQWVAPSTSIPSTSFQNRYLVNSILPFIDTIISENVWVSVQCHTLPTSGTFSLYLFGEVR